MNRLCLSSLPTISNSGLVEINPYFTLFNVKISGERLDNREDGGEIAALSQNIYHPKQSIKGFCRPNQSWRLLQRLTGKTFEFYFVLSTG